MVKSGVFDEFEIDRGKIFNSIPRIIQKIKNINDDKKNHQSNLFSDQENAKEQREENERVINETNEYARFIDELVKIFGAGQETVSQDTDDITTSSKFNDVLKNEIFY